MRRGTPLDHEIGMPLTAVNVAGVVHVGLLLRVRDTASGLL